jgi:glutaredoxin
MNKAVFYHAGCPVCVNAENRITEIVDRSNYDVEIVHLGQQRNRIAEAAGVKSVPALKLGSDVLPINFGASMADVMGYGQHQRNGRPGQQAGSSCVPYFHTLNNGPTPPDTTGQPHRTGARTHR